MAKLFSMSSAISQRPLRLKALSRRLTIIVHHPFDALPKENHVEIDQQANWNIKQPEVRQKLSLINRMNNLFTLKFDHDSVFHHKVGTKATIQFHRLIH